MKTENNINDIRNSSFCIVIYDISDNRVQKVNKILKRMLFHKQNSIFIGQISKSDAISIYNEIKAVIVPEEDEVCFMFLKNKFEMKEVVLGERNINKHVDEDDYIF